MLQNQEAVKPGDYIQWLANYRRYAGKVLAVADGLALAEHYKGSGATVLHVINLAESVRQTYQGQVRRYYTQSRAVSYYLAPLCLLRALVSSGGEWVGKGMGGEAPKPALVLAAREAGYVSKEMILEYIEVEEAVTNRRG